MSTDKSAWPRVRFGDVVRLNTDRCADPLAACIERYVGLEHIDPEDLRIRRWGLVAEGTTFTNLFRPGQVLFGKRRAYQRKVAVADFAGVCSSDIYVFEPQDDRLLPELLPFLCQTEAFYEYAVGTSAGSLSPRTNWGQLADYEFALPPLEEQRRLADMVAILDNCIGQYAEAHSKLGILLTSYIEGLIWKYRQLRCQQLVDSLLVEAPRNGYSPPTNDTQQGLRTVSISAVSGGVFEPAENIKYAAVSPEQVQQFFVCRDDIFVVRGNGNRKLTGKCGIAHATYDDLFYPDLLIRLRFDPEKIVPSFAALIWNSPSLHEDLITRAKSTNGIWKINGQDIRQHRLVVPPLDVQQAFVLEVAEILLSAASILKRTTDLRTIRTNFINTNG